ncbi:MAG: topoisomerase DNA-binding C4 zinc finger domain-containing protein [Candidatus Delongbacteria bacterium]|jgi:hypothetical protein|nr:topoisomerase DNA-binding C4 zinc finger domain-containing protein [Candidatus Delongbacteria bacterium]
MNDSGIKCPKCNSPMKLRAGKFGKFYGCSAFPICKGIVPYGSEPQNFDNETVVIKTKWVAGPGLMEFTKNNEKIADWKYVDGKVTEKNGEVLNGVVNSFYPDGALKGEITFENNEMNGPYEEFAPNGKPMEKGQYVAGVKQVEFKSSDEPHAVDSSPDYSVSEPVADYADEQPAMSDDSSDEALAKSEQEGDSAIISSDSSPVAQGEDVSDDDSSKEDLSAKASAEDDDEDLPF